MQLTSTAINFMCYICIIHCLLSLLLLCIDIVFMGYNGQPHWGLQDAVTVLEPQRVQVWQAANVPQAHNAGVLAHADVQVAQGLDTRQILQELQPTQHRSVHAASRRTRAKGLAYLLRKAS